MGRKRGGFDYDSEAEEPWTPRIERASLADRRVVPDRARDIAKLLVAMNPIEWPHLPLDPLVVEGLHAYIRITQPKAMKRQLGHVAGLLRAADHDAIQAAIAGGRTEREERIEALVSWRTRILADVHEGLTAFLEIHPDADRQRIRQLAQAAQRAEGTPASAKAGKLLLGALKDAAGI